jgi:hypothetical protein
MQIDKILKEVATCAISAIVIFGCVQSPGTTNPQPSGIYHHVAWIKGSKTYLDVWTRGVEIVKQPWLGDPYASFYLGGRWESFPYDPDWDHIDVIPEPGYQGHDKLIYGRTGETVVY